ncbi:hypothetical protein RRG08_050594 [Elysia crispata]|uniref:Uncharacterized protein n=1 Tax=Elysia crispata TaxID=231223 RepID=A0AAE1DC28_9GAST|nr:hypothetical protein RRG08_050594 [Elysia crispata]
MGPALIIRTGLINTSNRFNSSQLKQLPDTDRVALVTNWIYRAVAAFRLWVRTTGQHKRLVSDLHGRDLKHWRAGHHVRLVSDTHGQLVISLQSHRIQTRQASGLYGALTGIRTWDLRARDPVSTN